jgi:hypothetical protein
MGMTEAERLKWYLVAEGMSWATADAWVRAIEEEFDLVSIGGRK